MKRAFLIASLVVLTALAACGATELTESEQIATQLAPTCEPLGAEQSGVVFSDEQATHVIDMVDNATLDELQTINGIGPSIAQRIVDARPFRSHLNPLSKLDAVPWVGPEVLASLRASAFDAWCRLDDGRQSCCIELSCTGGGAGAAVPVTDDEAFALLDWANRASFDELVLVCRVGPEIAQSIIDARPLRTVAQLEQVPLVGDALVRHMLGRDHYLCSLQGSVFEEWCGLADAQCVCQDAAQ